jgi:hypothetical protein
MTDETLSATPEPATATPAVVEQTPETEPVNLQAPAIEEGATPEVEQSDDFEELEWSGKKFKAPKGLKDGVLMHADYTRKTQEVAESRKALEAEQARIAQQAKASEEEMNIRVGLRHINSELDRLKDYGWNEYQQAAQSDPLGAREAWDYKQYLQQQKAEAEQQISAKQSERTTQTQQETAKRLEATLDYARKIPGMTQQTHEQVLKLAVDRGVPKDRLAEVMDPVVYGILHDAWLGQQVKAAKAAPQTPAAAPATPAPLTVVRGNAPAKKSLEAMDMAEFVAARKAGRKG